MELFVGRRRQAGQVLPFVALLVALTGVIGLAVAQVATHAIAGARAQAAADAAALAAVDGGPAAAARVAVADRAVVARVVPAPGGYFVEVELHGHRAAAQAARGDPATSTVAPAIRAALARARQVLGAEIVVAAVDPSGLAIRVGPGVVQHLTASGAQAGLCPVPGKAPGWFEICPSGQG